MYLKEAVVGRLVWQNEDAGYIKRILEMPVARKTGVKIIDDFNKKRTEKHIKETMFGVLGEMKDMKRKEPVYLDHIKVIFARTMLNLDMDCEKEIKPLLESISCGTIRHSTSLEFANAYNNNGNVDAVEALRTLFDLTGGHRGHGGFSKAIGK